MKYLSDPIVNRTRDLPASSEVPQLTAPPNTPQKIFIWTNSFGFG